MKTRFVSCSSILTITLLSSSWPLTAAETAGAGESTVHVEKTAVRKDEGSAVLSKPAAAVASRVAAASPPTSRTNRLLVWWEDLLGESHQRVVSRSEPDALVAGAATAAVSPQPNAAGGTLNVSGTYPITANDAYQYVNVGFNSAGTVNHSAGTLTIGSSGTNGIGELDIGTSYAGTYNLSGSAVLYVYGDFYIGDAVSGAFVQNGGTVTVPVNEIDLGASDSGTSTYLLNTGTVTTRSLILGDLGTATFTQAGGTVTVGGNTPVGQDNTQTFAFGAKASTYQLNGGTLTIPDVYLALSTNQATFNFNGGILQASIQTSAYPFMTGLLAANVQGGGAKIDTNGLNITIGQALLHGGTGTDGGLSKQGGPGTLTLTGANSYNGGTTVSVGTLALGNGGTFGTAGVTDSAAISFVNTANLTVRNAISGTGTVTQSGTGTTKLTAVSAFGGTTSVSAGTLQIDNGATGPATTGQLTGTTGIAIGNGGTLLLSGSATVTDRLNNGAGVTINGGGKLSTGGLQEGAAPTAANGVGGAVGIGALTLTATTSSLRASIDFGNTAAGSALVFSSLASGGKGSFVSILDFSGAARGDSGAATNDRLLFTSDPGFTLADLSNWQFSNDAGTNFITGGMEITYNGYIEIVPVPEPATWFGSVLLLGLLGVGAWRRRARRA